LVDVVDGERGVLIGGVHVLAAIAPARRLGVAPGAYRERFMASETKAA
jgi:hypothetical protein